MFSVQLVLVFGALAAPFLGSVAAVPTSEFLAVELDFIKRSKPVDVSSPETSKRWLTETLKLLCETVHISQNGNCCDKGVCTRTYDNQSGESYCNNGKCWTDCATGYTFSSSEDACVETCSACAADCDDGETYDSATGKCVSSCDNGYTYDSETKTCVFSASSRTRRRNKRATEPITEADLCPTGTFPCPIDGASSFSLAQSLLFSQSYNTLIRSEVGYECVTDDSLENCGGCTSLGRGKNCSSLSNVASTRCIGGIFLVNSCSDGSSPVNNEC